jgi:hypothetical protein
MKTILKIFSLCFYLTLLTQLSNAQWTALTNPSPDGGTGNIILLSDGRVLCHTNNEPTGDIFDILTPDANGSYINGTWTRSAESHQWRYSYPSEMLKNGQVYVAGGEYGTDGTQNGQHAEVYDPVTNSWTQTGAPGNVISDGSVQILEDGRVLQAMLYDFNDLKHTTIYDPVANTFSAGPDCRGVHNESMWVKLPDNSILMVDMPRLDNAYTYTWPIHSERYIPATNTWIADADVPDSLYDEFGFETGAALMLPDGRAFFMGSTHKTAYYTPSGNTSPGTWTEGPDIPDQNGLPDAPAAMMVDGKILFACSPVPSSGNTAPKPTYWYVFDYLTETYTPINAPQGGASYNDWSQHNVLLNLPNGEVLEESYLSTQYYVYTPGSPIAAGKPSIVSYINCDKRMLTGHLFNGISEGSAFNDENQNSSNYPIVQLKNGSNIYYCRTFNWNSTGVQRGSALDSVEFAPPAGLPAGTYELRVIANGFASDPISVSDFTIYPSPVATASASPNPVCSNSTLFLTGGPAAMTTYAWTGPNGYSSGSQSPSIVNPAPAYAGVFTLTVTNSGGCTSTASTASVVINTPPTVTLNPSNVSAEWGDSPSFTSTASGTPAPTVQWQLSTDGGFIFNDISGETNTTLNLTCVTLDMNGYKYQAVFTNTCGTSTSSVATLSVRKKAVTANIVVAPNPRQYSDTVSITVTIPNGYTCGTYAATGAEIYIGTQDMGSVTFTVSGSDLVGELYAVRLLEPSPYGTPPVGQMAPGNHLVTAVLTGANSNFNITNNGTTLTITPEDARAYYTGALYVGTTTATSHNAVVTLAATFKDITAVLADPAYDIWAGDIRNATISFINRDNNTIIASNVPFGLVSPADSKVAVATYNWNVTISGNSQTFTVGIIIGRYYTDNTNAEDAIITVAQPLTNTVTGGGYLILTSPGGIKAGDIGSKENFGYNAKYNNGGSHLQGNMNTIVRKTESSVLHTYQIKCNQLTSISVHTSSVGGTATINGRGMIQDITNPSSPVMVDNNASLQMNITDNGNPGNTDLLGITIWNRLGGLWFASNWNGTSTVQQVISAGNEVVHSNSSFRPTSENELIVSTESMTAYPNPAGDHITVSFNCTSEERYAVSIIDLTGRTILSEVVNAAEGNNIHEISLKNVAKGMYILLLENANTKEQKRIIIQ